MDENETPQNAPAQPDAAPQTPSEQPWPFPPPPTNPPVGQSGLTGPIGGSDPALRQRRKRRLPKWLKIVLIVIAVLLIGIILIGVWHDLQFTSYTYKDKQGTEFSLRFYKGATMKPATAMPPLLGDNTPNSGAMSDFLVAGSGKYPLSLYIAKTSDDLYSKNALCREPALKLDTPAAGQSDVVCDLVPGDDKEYVYFYQIADSKNKYLVVITQDFGAYSEVSPADAEARQAQLLDDPELDLRQFNADLQTILPSIKVAY